MNNLIQISKDKQAVTTSIRVAEVFGKEHRNVLKAINTLIGGLREQEDFSHPKNGVASELKNELAKFAVADYKDEQGKPRKQYIMNRDGFTLLAMGFTGPKALKFKLQYIEAFNAMEQKLRAQEVQQKVEALMGVRRVDSRVKPENDNKNNVPENDNKAADWEISDTDLIDVLHRWHATKNKKDTEFCRKITAENEQLKTKLAMIKQAVR